MNDDYDVDISKNEKQPLFTCNCVYFACFECCASPPVS